jgi:hypothetical protein
MSICEVKWQPKDNLQADSEGTISAIPLPRDNLRQLGFLSTYVHTYIESFRIHYCMYY